MDGITNSVEIRLSKIWEMVKGGEAYVLQSMGSNRVGHDKAAEQQNKPILSTAQRLQDLAHLNSPVTAVNRSLCLTYLGSQFLHRHGATSGKADPSDQSKRRVEPPPPTPHPTKPAVARNSTLGPGYQAWDSPRSPKGSSEDVQSSRRSRKKTTPKREGAF